MSKDNHTVEEIARAWVDLHKVPENSEAYDTLFWSFCVLDHLVGKDREKAWIIIHRIRQLDGSDPILGVLAAGPVEDLLVEHGEEFIDRVEALARTDAQFRKTLGCVWQNGMPDEIWNRMKAVADPEW